ncbi:MAG: LysM domain-containing protein [Rudaea sp.]|nr:LysM domain-containing protein [Rudaea sp.]
MLKKLPAVCAGLLLTLSVFAATVELNEHHPDTYTVQKGDTLWSISARFLQRPWQWPEVWQANPQVRNPHLIYPGDVINLAYVNGRPRLGVAGQQDGFGGPRVRTEAVDDAIKPVPLSAIEDFLKKPRIVSDEDFKHAPHVVGIEDHHINGTTGQLIYVRGLDAAAGQQFALVRPLGRYYEITSKDGQPTATFRQSLEDSDNRPQMLWHDGPWNFTLHGDVHFIGYEVIQYGTVQVTHAGNPASTLVLSSDIEVRTGDYVLPLDTVAYDFEYVPHPPRQVPANMRVIAFTDALNAVGRLQVVALSNGANAGVENGQVYSIFSPGDVVSDDTDYPESSTKAFLHPHDSQVQLPEEYVGHVMVFRTFEHVSYGLIMDGIRPVHLNDRLYEPDHK